MMIPLQTTCWTLLVSSFAFGISERWLSGELGDVAIAMCVLLVVVPLCPLLNRS